MGDSRVGKQGAVLAPEMVSSTKVGAGSQFLTKSSWDPGWLTSARRVTVRDQFPMAHLRWRSCCVPRKPRGWDQGGDDALPTWGECSHQAPGCLSCSDLGSAQMQAQLSLCLCGILKKLNMNSLDLRNAQNPGPTLDSSPAEQPEA